MPLTEKPEFYIWPASHYIFIEKVGPFQNTAPAAWAEFHDKLDEVSKSSRVIGMTSLYRVEPIMIYRAGAMLATKPGQVPAGMAYEYFAGGKYARFTLRGSYSQLPDACGRVFEIVEETQMAVRDDYCLENYLNDPKVTPEADLVTEILIPVE